MSFYGFIRLLLTHLLVRPSQSIPSLKMFFQLASKFHYSKLLKNLDIKRFANTLKNDKIYEKGQNISIDLYYLFDKFDFNKVMNPGNNSSGIIIKSKSQYSCLEKLLCCKCFSCLQEEKVMTSDLRKQTIKRMVQSYLVQNDDTILYDPVQLMILIYICNDDTIPAKHIEKCKINPSTGVNNYRTDLQFYVRIGIFQLPQICNFIVFHRNLEKNYLRDAIQQICKLNFYFSHLYYFYMKSIEKNITKSQIQVLKPVVEYNQNFVSQLSNHYQHIKCSSLDQYIDQYDTIRRNQDQFFKRVIKDYQTTKIQYGKFAKVKPEDIQIKVYKSVFQGDKGNSKSFQSTISFFEDLFYLSNDLKNYNNKKEKTIQFIKMINQNLPSNVYIPFSKNCYRLCTILKIVTSQVKIFSTKHRAPICLCLEIYSPSQQLTQVQEQQFWHNVQTPMALKMTSNAKRQTSFRNHQQTGQFRIQNFNRPTITHTFQQDKGMYFFRPTIVQVPFENKDSTSSVQAEQVQQKSNEYNKSIITSQSNQTDKVGKGKQKDNEDAQSNTSASYNHKKEQINKSKSLKKISGFTASTKKHYINGFNKMFGETLAASKKRIAKNSVFGNFSSWDILYIIIKTNDDLKQQQFAMQLLHQFDYIFKLEEIPLLITTYQILSMGPNCGIIEMVKDSVTFDSLKKTLKTEFPSALSLTNFFQIFFQENVVQAKQNFIKSLAAYCLVMYIIQAKDRHNGNILLHRDGKIFHIDFGFFLSNLPGKGIQLEKDCPFKLLTQYVEVMDGVESYYFKKFREYFFLGFKAIRKHQNKIIMLVKMMYSSSGMSMPCFQKGQMAITALQQRINPKGMINDLLLNEHCQQLINRSLDNWASKWYDRFQYWAQGIFY